ncbi:MAG: DUF4261 domain-containing protein [Muribaculaceae bacterium]|nr:DUF4261 domain-containing protein [Muribaculaceae bacterium]
MSEKTKEFGNFISFILLSEPHWDCRQFVKNLKNEWDVDLSNADKDDNNVVEKYGDGFISVAFIQAPIPNREAEYCAKSNYLWSEAEDVTKTHKAHIIVAVTGNNDNIIEKAKLTTKIADACLKQKYAVAVYTGEAVYEPRFYHLFTQWLREDILPIPDWIWFGIYKHDGKQGIYTDGLRKFGKKEIEVYADASYDDIRDFMLEVVNYVIADDVTLKDGQTIGLTEDQKLPITLSKGIALDGDTLKIAYRKG